MPRSDRIVPDINDIQDYIDPSFIADMEKNGGGTIHISGEVVIESYRFPDKMIEIPLVDGNTAVFDGDGTLIRVEQ